MVSCGAILLYKEMSGPKTKKNMMKKGKQYAKKLGII